MFTHLRLFKKWYIRSHIPQGQKVIFSKAFSDSDLAKQQFVSLNS